MTTYAVKVEGGSAKIYDAKTGNYQRQVGSNVVSAQVNGDILQVTEKSGTVKIYDARTGNYQRQL